MRFFRPPPAAGLIGVKRRVAVRKDAISFALEVFELPLVHGPAEHGHDEEHQDRGERNEQVQDVHAASVQRAARKALSTTASELRAMPSPASQGGSHPTSASGMQTAL